MKLASNLMLGLALAAATALAGVDSALLNLVPPDAKIISGISVDQSKTSRFGQYVLGQMTVEDPGMKKFIADTGFDPRRDLNELLVATSGTSDAPQFVVLGRGVFNPAKILNTAIAAGAIVTPYGNGIQLLTPPAGTKSQNAVAFLDASTAVMGPVAVVKTVIDRRTSGTRLDAATQAKVRDLASVNDAWFVSTVPVTDFFAGKLSDPNMNQAMSGNLFQAVKSANGGVKFTSEAVKISGEALTRSEQDASALADVIRFVAGLVAQNKSNDPNAAKAATLLQTLQLTTQAATLKLSLSIPESMMEEMFMPQAHPKKAAVSHNKTARLVHAH